jgi:putative ABC transport system permease protein
VQGRFLTEQEVAGKQRAMVVNQTFVQRYAAGPGRMVRVRRGRELVGDPFQIVGVVKDRVNRLATNETLPEMYVPYSFRGQAERIYISTAIRPEGLIRAMSAQVYAADAAQPVMDTKTLEVLLRELVYARPRFNLILFLIFSGLGLMLALLGVYGVISHAVTQQRREIGIRIALGARLGQVVGMMLGMGARLLAIGIAAGLAGSLASIKLLNGLVRNISTFDPWSFAAVSVLLLAAGLFASYWPARRAARIDPVTALRDE